jgi:hypothetical protein
LATSKAVRADDVSGLNIATVQATEDALTKDYQRIVVNDPTTPANMAGVDGSGNLKVVASGTVTANAGSGTLATRPSDGTNPITKTFDNDSGAGAEYNLGVSLRKSASGGSVELGTSTDPVRTDPTGTTNQPITASSLPLPTGAAIASKQPAIGTAGTPSADVISIQGIASMTKLLVTPDSVALPANQSVNVNQLAGTTTDTNSGNKSAGTLRVVVATDQPNLTTPLNVAVAKDTGAGNVANNQISVATTATVIAAARATRRGVVVVNHGTTDVLLGGTNAVTTANGLKLKGTDGAAIYLPITTDLYGIVGSGTQTVSYMEVYD